MRNRSRQCYGNITYECTQIDAVTAWAGVTIDRNLVRVHACTNPRVMSPNDHGAAILEIPELAVSIVVFVRSSVAAPLTLAAPLGGIKLVDIAGILA